MGNKNIFQTKFSLDLRGVGTTVFMVITYVFCLSVFVKNSLHIPYGDGPEYVMMTESFYNHQTPNLTKKDVAKYVDYLENKDFQIHRKGEFVKALNMDNDNAMFLGFVKSHENEKMYCYHFWMYSVFCVPARFILGYLQADIRAAGLMTNMFLIFFGAWLILRMKAFTQGQRIILALLLVFSPMLFYIDWTHTEVFSGILVFLAMVYYSTQRKYLSLFLFSLASTQNPTLFVPALFIFCEILYKNGLKLKVLLKLFICSFWIILPALFYKYHFGVISVISDSGVLQWDVVSFRRLWGFFFDLNQGLILGIPLLLLLIIVFMIYDLVKRKSFKPYIFIGTIFIMSLFFMQMTVWNDGNAVIKRYAVWCASIIIVVFFLRILKLKKHWFYIISCSVLLTQFAAISYQHSFFEARWHASYFNKLSRYVMNNFPSFYNPEPIIFKYRLQKFELSTTDSVMVYTDNKKRIKKMLIAEGAISQLQKRGLSKENVAKLDAELNYRNGYAYVNHSDLEKYGYSQKNDTLIEFIEKTKKERFMKAAEENIRSDPNWFGQVTTSAEEENISIDSVMTRATTYIYQLERERFEKAKGFNAN